MVSFLLGRYVQVELLAYMDTLHLTFWENLSNFQNQELLFRSNSVKKIKTQATDQEKVSHIQQDIQNI